MALDRPTATDLISWLKESLQRSLGDVQLSFLSESVAVADGTTALLVSDALGRPRAVVLCSSPAAPGMIQRAIARANQAREALDARLGEAILRPLAEGSVHGLTYAVLPYCAPLSEIKFTWWTQRLFLRPSVLRWLRDVTRRSAREVPAAVLEKAFLEPLRRLARLGVLGDAIAAASRRGIERLSDGIWKPRFVLMHGDLWKGNILIRAREALWHSRPLRDRFVVIDWAGCEIDGFAIYDLVRLARSMQLNGSSLRREIQRHCEILGCELPDARGYLLAALAHIVANREYFPIDRFAAMAESCVASLDEIAI